MILLWTALGSPAYAVTPIVDTTHVRCETDAVSAATFDAWLADATLGPDRQLYLATGSSTVVDDTVYVPAGVVLQVRLADAVQCPNAGVGSARYVQPDVNVPAFDGPGTVLVGGSVTVWE